MADFTLESDLCLKPDSAPLTIEDKATDFHLTLTNAPGPDGGAGSALIAELVFECKNLSDARQIAMELLADILSCLTYATNRKFSYKTLKRIIDWTPGIIDREAVLFVEQPVWCTAEPELSKGLLDSAGRLFAMRSGEEQRAAMRWYRLAIQEDNKEQQFSYFWFALEIAAQYGKPSEKITSKCPVCKESLYCAKCGTHPVHRRYEGEAIQFMIARVHPQNADEVFKTLQKIRHTLMHGERIESVVPELPCDDVQAINKLAFVTWRAIELMFDKPDPRPGEMHLGYVDNLVRGKVIGSAHIVTTLMRDHDNPRLANFPTIDFSMREPERPRPASKAEDRPHGFDH